MGHKTLGIRFDHLKALLFSHPHSSMQYCIQKLSWLQSLQQSQKNNLMLIYYPLEFHVPRVGGRLCQLYRRVSTVFRDVPLSLNKWQNLIYMLRCLKIQVGPWLYQSPVWIHPWYKKKYPSVFSLFIRTMVININFFTISSL